MTILKIITGTPWWVFIIFIYLLSVGIQSLKDKTVFLPKLFIIPAIVIGLKLNDHISNLYLMCLGLGAILGWLISRRINIQKEKNLSIKIPGTWQTLSLLMIIFIIKYFLGYMRAAMPEIYTGYIHIEDVALGIISGLFLGRVICYSYKWYKGV